jgi:Leucine-rich repeat (LRR) protein
MMRSISATPSRWSLLMWALVAIGCGSEPSLAPRSTGLTFSDPALDTAIRFAIQKPTGAITPGDIAGLQWLSVPRRGVVDLSGMQNLTSLRSLDPSGNRITSVLQLAGLRNLEIIYLNNNQVSDVTPLASLTALSYLDLSGNEIEDVGPLGELANLELLYIGGNKIQDIRPLSRVTSLQVLRLSSNRITSIASIGSLISLNTLYLSNNEISDISSLEDLPLLFYLSLFGNPVVDLGPLIHNPGIGTFDTIVLTENPLSEEALSVQVPSLKRVG